MCVFYYNQHPGLRQARHYISGFGVSAIGVRISLRRRTLGVDMEKYSKNPCTDPSIAEWTSNQYGSNSGKKE